MMCTKRLRAACSRMEMHLCRCNPICLNCIFECQVGHLVQNRSVRSACSDYQLPYLRLFLTFVWCCACCCAKTSMSGESGFHVQRRISHWLQPRMLTNEHATALGIATDWQADTETSGPHEHSSSASRLSKVNSSARGY
jgi:hypothetical protein